MKKTLPKQGWLAPKYHAAQLWQSLDLQYVIEAAYLAASLTFLVGSGYFFPGKDMDYRLGCRLFDVGSVAFAVLSAYSLLSARPLPPAREMAEHALYLVGSLLFMAGCLISDPDLTPLLLRFGGSQTWWSMQAALLFMVGSFLFAFAAFCNMLTIYYSPPVFPGAALTITSCYEFGGMLFVTGTMGFIPGLGCSDAMQTLGCWGYLVGSGFYVFGSALSLAKFVATRRLAAEREKMDVPPAGVVALLREQGEARRRCHAATEQVLRGDEEATLWSKFAKRESDVAAALERAMVPEQTLWNVLCSGAAKSEKTSLLG